MHLFDCLFPRQPEPQPTPPQRPQYICNPRTTNRSTKPCSISTLQQVEMLSAYLPELWSVIRSKLVPGNTTADVQSAYLSFIQERNLSSAFMGYRGYPEHLTISINHEVTHTLPSKYRYLKDGDLVKIQFGLKLASKAITYQGWSFAIGSSTLPNMQLINAGREALALAVTTARSGVSIGEVSFAIHDTLARAGLWPSEDYCGHGIGTSMHMEPPVPCVAPLDINQTPVILPGTLLSIVVMAHTSRPVLRIHRDGWSVVDINRALSVLFSHVIVVDRDTTRILTPKLQ